MSAPPPFQQVTVGKLPNAVKNPLRDFLWPRKRSEQTPLASSRSFCGPLGRKKGVDRRQIVLACLHANSDFGRKSNFILMGVYDAHRSPVKDDVIFVYPAASVRKNRRFFRKKLQWAVFFDKNSRDKVTWIFEKSVIFLTQLNFEKFLNFSKNNWYTGSDLRPCVLVLNSITSLKF